MVKKEKITKNMSITEVVQKNPKIIEILFKEGLHCLGCAAAHFETLEQGLLAHGKTKKEIEKIIEKLNKAL